MSKRVSFLTRQKKNNLSTFYYVFVLFWLVSGIEKTRFFKPHILPGNNIANFTFGRFSNDFDMYNFLKSD